MSELIDNRTPRVMHSQAVRESAAFDFERAPFLVIWEVKAAGLSRVAVSLDGPDPETHDAFRSVRGSYANTLKIIDATLDLGLPLQINSTVSRRTLAATGHAFAEDPLCLHQPAAAQEAPPVLEARGIARGRLGAAP